MVTRINKSEALWASPTTWRHFNGRFGDCTCWFLPRRETIPGEKLLEKRSKNRHNHGNSNPGHIGRRECGHFIHYAPFFAAHLDPTFNCPLGADNYSGIVQAEFKVCSQQHWLDQVIWQNSHLLTTKITAYFANWCEALFLYLQIQFCLKIQVIAFSLSAIKMC